MTWRGRRGLGGPARLGLTGPGLDRRGRRARAAQGWDGRGMPGQAWTDRTAGRGGERQARSGMDGRDRMGTAGFERQVSAGCWRIGMADLDRPGLAR